MCHPNSYPLSLYNQHLSFLPLCGLRITISFASDVHHHQSSNKSFIYPARNLRQSNFFAKKKLKLASLWFSIKVTSLLTCSDIGRAISQQLWSHPFLLFYFEGTSDKLFSFRIRFCAFNSPTPYSYFIYYIRVLYSALFTCAPRDLLLLPLNPWSIVLMKMSLLTDLAGSELLTWVLWPVAVH